MGDLGQLAGTIGEAIGSSIDDVIVTVDEVAVPTDADVPASGPATVPFSAALPDGLAEGSHEICATAEGTDAVGSGSVTECVTVEAVPSGTVVIDCGDTTDDCVGTAEDPGVSVLVFDAPPDFDETVRITPNAGGPDECGGTGCRTGYDVIFPSSDPDGPVASITVTTLDRVRLRDRLRAAVFIDDVQIRDRCNEFHPLLATYRAVRHLPEPTPCQSIRLLRDKRLQYYVEFNADPAFRLR